MKLKHWVQFVLRRDTTYQGQFRAIQAALCGLSGYARYVVDVGANDGFYNSNSYPFIARGWRALLIEPNPRIAEKARELHRNRPGVAVASTACSEQEGTVDLVDYLDDGGGGHAHLVLGPGTRSTRGTDTRRQFPVTVRRLEALLEEQAAPPDYGVLSIDTEGHDREVLLGAGLDRYRPRVIITEHGPAEEAKDDVLRAQGYALFRRLVYDSVWRRV